MCVYVCGVSTYMYAFSFPFELKACGSGPLVQCSLLSFIWVCLE